VRFTADEYAELAAAATRAGLTTTGYIGEAALAAARGVNATGQVDTGAITRAELAALQRVTGLWRRRAGLPMMRDEVALGFLNAAWGSPPALLDGRPLNSGG
jgi:hypothetical protein